MHQFELQQIINNELQVTRYRDYAPNGLQVQGRSEVKKIVTGVTACQLLLDKAVELHADAVLVHHGYFWKNEPQTITGIKYHRMKTLLKHDINLYSYHLPLDGHPVLGNNVLLGQMLDITVDMREDITDLLFTGTLNNPLTALEFKQKLEQKLHNGQVQCCFVVIMRQL